jgi:predicted nucleic acid-binding protein
VFVLDASLALSWVFDEEETERSREVLHRILDDVVVVPSVWPLEVANAVLIGLRHSRFTEEDAASFVDALSGFDVDVDEQAHRVAFVALVPLAQELGLTSYDAAYIELALRRDAPLATFDAGLARAARAAGVELLLQD